MPGYGKCSPGRPITLSMKCTLPFLQKKCTWQHFTHETQESLGAFGSLAKAVFLARLGYTFGNPNIILLLGAASLGGPENPRSAGRADSARPRRQTWNARNKLIHAELSGWMNSSTTNPYILSTDLLHFPRFFLIPNESSKIFLFSVGCRDKSSELAVPLHD